MSPERDVVIFLVFQVTYPLETLQLIKKLAPNVPLWETLRGNKAAHYAIFCYFGRLLQLYSITTKLIHFNAPAQRAFHGHLFSNPFGAMPGKLATG
jgi:hypothetical protein